MRLSWNEIRVRAAEFAREWEDAGYEKGETHSFYNDFFKIFGVKRRTVGRYEQHISRLDNSHGYIDLFWPGVLLVEQKSAGVDLEKARKQADAYFDALPEHERPRYQLHCDFQTFELIDRDEPKEVCFGLAELPEHIEEFGFILGVQKRKFKDQDPVNIEASERVGLLHDALAESGYTGRKLEQFLVRIVFCFFADDTGIFERDIFLDLLEGRTRRDGSDLGGWLAQLFQVLNTPEDQRAKTLDEELARFPYVNGDLFREMLPIPSFDSKMRQRLINACHFNWTAISPAIFGSLFQSVMNKDDRRAQGAHYTTEQNILKVIEPLFLDELRTEFHHLKLRRDIHRIPALHAFQRRLGDLRFLDPACGCGNFLIIAYRKLRELEIEVLKEIRPKRQIDAFAEMLSVVDVDQFYGIELGDFPAHIAEVALWMMDHIMNRWLSEEFGQIYTRIPLKKSPHIRQGDALEFDWSELLPPEECSYVLGNPPFIGQSYQSQSQRRQMAAVINAPSGRAGSLDYVGAWYLKAGEFVQNCDARIGFVATNSITQGEQVAQLWPILFERYKLEITYAHRTFAWGSDVRGMAHVHVVIIGLAKRADAPRQKRLFSYDTPKSDPQESLHTALSPYLFHTDGLAASRVVVKESTLPLNGLPEARMGTKPVVGAHYLFNDTDKVEFIAQEPAAARFFRPFIGAVEFLQGKSRWILHLDDAEPEELRKLPLVRRRISAVRKMRAESRKRATRILADFPTKYEVNVIPTAPFLVVPEVSSERRDYIPIAWLEPPVIPSNKIRILPNASLWQFRTPDVRNAHGLGEEYWWVELESRLSIQYRNWCIYNTFPLPPVQSERLERPRSSRRCHSFRSHASSRRDACRPVRPRPNASRSPQGPPGLWTAPWIKLYRRSGFASERDRVEHLFGLYEKMVAPVTAMVKPKRRQRKPR